MRVLTYNLKYLSGKNHARALIDVFHRRKIKKTIANDVASQLSTYDIVCLQEVGFSPKKRENHIRTLMRKAGFIHFTAGFNHKILHHRNSGNAILSKIEFINHGNFPLNSHHFVHTKFGVPPIARGATYADLWIEGKLVRVITTHLGLTPYDRRSQMRRLSGFLKKSPKNVILTGDFNAFPRSDVLKQFIFENRLRPAVPFDAGPSYRYWVKMRIDYIFYRGDITCSEAGILPEKYSDHYPLMASFDFGAQ